MAAALFFCRLPCKVGTHPIPLFICFIIFRNVYFARITAIAHRYGNTLRVRLSDIRTLAEPVVAKIAARMKLNHKPRVNRVPQKL